MANINTHMTTEGEYVTFSQLASNLNQKEFWGLGLPYLKI
jgi:hypothetical protein